MIDAFVKGSLLGLVMGLIFLFFLPAGLGPALMMSLGFGAIVRVINVLVTRR
jgi:hypothetical protein